MIHLDKSLGRIAYEGYAAYAREQRLKIDLLPWDALPLSIQACCEHAAQALEAEVLERDHVKRCGNDY